MISTLPSKYYRKSRLAIDSMLACNGASSHYATLANPNIQFSKNDSFSICFFFAIPVNPASLAYVFTNNANPGGTNSQLKGIYCHYSPSVGRLTLGIGSGNNEFEAVYFEGIQQNMIGFAAFTFDAATATFKSYRNGIYKNTKVRTYTWDFLSTQPYTVNCVFQSNTPTAFNNLNINHLTFFNGVLTEQEIRSIHQLGGILPKSTHEACVAHYIAQPGAGKIWDVVEQYNYTKVTALEPYHGQPVNFTDEELAMTDSYANTSFRDLYPPKGKFAPYLDTNEDETYDIPLIEKSSLLPPLQNALLGSATQFIRAENVIPTKSPTTVTRETTVRTVICIPDGEYDLPVYFIAGTSGQPLRDYHLVSLSYLSGVQKIDFDGANSGSSNRFKEFVLPVISPSWHTLEVQYIPTATSFLNDVKIYIDGVLLLSASDLHDFIYSENTSFTIDAKRAGFYTAYTAVFERITTRKEIIQAANNTLLSNPTNKTDLWCFWNFNQIVDDTAVSGNYLIPDQSGNGNDAVLNNYTSEDVALSRYEINALREPDDNLNGLCLRLDRADNEYIHFERPASNAYFLFPIGWFFPLAAEEQILWNFHVRGTYVKINADGTLYVSAQDYTSTAKVKFGQWNHIAMRNPYSAQDLRLWINGETEYNATQIAVCDEYLRVGQVKGAIPGFNGYVYRPGIMEIGNGSVSDNDVFADYRGETVYGTERISPIQDLPDTPALFGGVANTAYNSDNLTKARSAYIARKSGRNLVAYE